MGSRSPSKSDAWVGGGDVVEKLLAVLANNRLLVVAGHIVPGDAIVINVVQNSQT